MYEAKAVYLKMNILLITVGYFSTKILKIQFKM